ncbi:FtsX-like permease family protein [Candidatus Bathyarchaeota archaeon]|nr:FtsX-like permease family protein [Candidatus Bathyarchaeota archaeon]MBS7617472.1 FtsX-like permease family protein [Candidatus Bathyarchaeota archaeon]
MRRLSTSLLSILLLIVTFSILTHSSIAFTAESLRVYGKVEDHYTSKPVYNASIIAIPWRGSVEEKYFQTYTDSFGFYELLLPMYDRYGARCEYVVYVLHRNSSTGLIDYVPAVYPEDVSKGGVRESLEVNFRLVPGASIEIYPRRKFDIWYILSRTAPSWYLLTIVDASTFETPVLPKSTVVIYGEPPIYTVKQRLGIYGADIQFLSSRDLFMRNLVVVPADTPIYLIAKMEFRNERTMRKEILPVLIGFRGGPFILSKGQHILLDIRGDVYKLSTDAIEVLSRDLERRFVQAEEEGFYLGAEREDLRDRVLSNVESAKHLLPPINFNPTDSDLDAVRFQFIEEAYFNFRLLENRLVAMRVLAQSHSTFYPLFFAVFSIAVGSFLFEDARRKILTALILYVLVIITLYYIYPGFKIIMHPETKVVFSFFDIGKSIGLRPIVIAGSLFFISVIMLSIAVVVGLYFGLPRIYRPPEIEGKPSLKSIITVIFSIGKRNVKRRKLRSAFCIISLAMLIMVLTAFTSFSRIQGVVIEGPDSTNVQLNGCLLEKIPFNNTKVLSVDRFFVEGELEALRAYGAERFLIRVDNIPLNSSIIRLRTTTGRLANLYGVLGLTEEIAEELGLTAYLPIGFFTKNMAIALTESLAGMLGVKPGDMIQVSSLSGGVEVNTWNFTVAGYVNDAILEASDINGKPIAPYKLTGEGEYAPVNATEFAVFNAWEILSLTSQEGEVIGLSDMIGIPSVFIPINNENALNSFANRMAFREYYAWVFFNGRVSRIYMGEKWEIKGFIELLVPATLVFLNVFMVMVNLIYERRREMVLLAALGLNPAHIASVFLAESIVMGLIGGGIGYYAGLGAYRIMNFLGPAGQIGVREKLEWYWGVIGLAFSITVSVLSAVVPAIRAAVMATPSLMRKIKIPEVERAKREEKIFKVYHERSIAMPIRVQITEKPFFTAFVMDRLKDISGMIERVENVSLEEEILADNTEVFRIRFTHTYREYATVNELRATKPPSSDAFNIVLLSKPKEPGMSEKTIDVTVNLMREILRDWDRYKKAILSGTAPKR